MSERAEHTPTPWRYEFRENTGMFEHTTEHRLVDAKGALLISTSDDGEPDRIGLGASDLQEIARRWNTHADLVAALEAAHENFDDAIHGRKPRHNQLAWAKQARAALAKAKGAA